MKVMNKLLWILFKRHYIGQIIYRSRDMNFNKIGNMPQEIVGIHPYTLDVRCVRTKELSTVIRHPLKIR